MCSEDITTAVTEQNIREVDNIGRIVIPKPMRKALGVADGGKLSMVFEDGAVIIRPHKPKSLSDYANAIIQGVNDGSIPVKNKEATIRIAESLCGHVED